jgi:shikimate dehydrogenase
MLQLGVFGNPIKHSLSPVIHNEFAKQLGLNISYKKILAPLDNFRACAQSFIDQGGAGFNVTVPFKLEAFNLAKELTNNAKSAGAVNTIKLKDGVLIGENTDGIGLVQDIIHNLKINLAQKNILILGAGGASQGILRPLLTQNPKRLMLANRTVEKALALKTQFASIGRICAFGLDDIKDSPVDIIINATSASLSGEMPNIASGCAKNALCYDLMYGKQTPFMRWAINNKACQATDGLGMLVEQAAASFEFWSGEKPKTQTILAQLRDKQ